MGPPTTFDAEEAPAVVASVFGERRTEVVAWDAPLVRIDDEKQSASICSVTSSRTTLQNAFPSPFYSRSEVAS